MVSHSTDGIYLGREEQLELLGNTLERAAAGSGSWLVIRGEEGAGVSSTLAVLRERALERGFRVATGNCTEGLGGRPFGGLAEALDGLARQTEPNELGTDVQQAGPSLARVAPALRASLSGLPPPAPLAVRDEVLRLHEGMLGWLQRAAGRQPLLIAIDDFQWADADTLAMLRHLEPYLAQLALIVATGWASADPATPAPTAQVVQLPGLDEGALGGLIARIAEEPLSGHTVRLLHEVSRGHPLTAIELYRHLRDEGMAARQGGDALPRPDEMPQTLEEVLAWRLSRFSLDERTALAGLACFPRPASSSEVAVVAGLPRTRAAEALERGVEHGLIVPSESGTRYEIRHRRRVRAIVERLAPPVRADALRRVIEVTEAAEAAETNARQQAATSVELWRRVVAEGPEGDPLGADARAGVRQCLIAAEQARSGYSFRAVAARLDLAHRLAKAGGVPDARDLRLRLVHALAEADQPDDAISEALGWLDDTPGRLQPADAEALLETVRVLRAHGRAEGAESLRARLSSALRAPSRQAALRLQLLAEGWRPVEQGALRWLAWNGNDDLDTALIEGGDEQDLSEVFAAQRSRTHDQTVELLNLARGWRRPAALLRALHGATVDLASRLGLVREALGWAGEYGAAAERFGSPLDRMRALLLLAQCQAMLGDFASATESVAASDDIGSRLAPADRLEDERLLAEMCIAHYLDADWASLATRATERLAEPRPAGLLLAAEAAHALGRLGDEGRAEPLLADSLAASTEWPPMTFLRDSALMVALTTAWESGLAQHAAAGRSLVRLALTAGAGGNHATTPELAIARSHALAGQVEEAREVFAGQRDALAAAGRRPLLAMVDYDEAICLAAAGKSGHRAATELLQQAGAAFDDLGMAGWHARARALLDDGLTRAAQPGGRLHFKYPRGLSRREADLVRMLSGGTSTAEAAAALDLDPDVAARHIDSALAKLEATGLEDLPRMARRYGLGGGL